MSSIEQAPETWKCSRKPGPPSNTGHIFGSNLTRRSKKDISGMLSEVAAVHAQNSKRSGEKFIDDIAGELRLCADGR